MYLSIIFSLFVPVVSIRVYEFKSGGAGSDVSSVIVKVSVPNVESFTICSSHKQFQTNDNTNTIYNIYEDKERSKPWIAIGFWDTALWAEVYEGIWYNMGKLKSVMDIVDWIHICLEIDFENKTLQSSINGNDLISTKPDLALQWLPEIYIGYFNIKKNNTHTDFSP